MIVRGEKREEYRACTNAQVARRWRDWFNNGLPAAPRVAIFRAGYCRSSPAIAVEVHTIGLRGQECRYRRHDWGEPRGREAYFAIALGRVLASGSYRDVKGKIDAMPENCQGSARGASGAAE